MMILIMPFLLLAMERKMEFLIGMSKISGVKIGEKMVISELLWDKVFAVLIHMPALLL
jgi:hypothetical protein